MTDSPKLGRLLRDQPGLDLAAICHGHNDGDCSWDRCPQHRDGEPEKSGRSCPLIWPEEALDL